MMTLAEIEGKDPLPEIYFDMNDSGAFYLKQDDEWIVMDLRMLTELGEAIQKQLERK